MYTIRLVKSTACLLLEKAGVKGYIDYEFINKFALENFMSHEDIMVYVRDFAARNNVTDYVVNI